jgi:hypothetical protein
MSKTTFAIRSWCAVTRPATSLWLLSLPGREHSRRCGGNIRHETMRCTIGQPRMEEIKLTSKIDIDVWVPDLRLPGWMDRWHQQAEEFNTLHPDYQVTVTGLDFFTFPQGPGEEPAAGRTPALAEYSPAGAGPAHR